MQFDCCIVTHRLGVKSGINLCLLMLSLSDQLFLLSKMFTMVSKVVLELAYGNEGASQWTYVMVSYHLVRKVSNSPTKKQQQKKHLHSRAHAHS